MNWNPIETAPRDGRGIIGTVLDENKQPMGVDIFCWGVYHCEVDGETHGWMFEQGSLDPEEPTHWIPMPSKPE